MLVVLGRLGSVSGWELQQLGVGLVQWGLPRSMPAGGEQQVDLVGPDDQHHP